MMLTRRRFLSIAAASGASGACPAQAGNGEWHGRALGADVRLQLAGEADRGGRVWRRIEALLHQIEAQFSLFADSELARLNAHGRLAWPSRDMQAVCALAGQVHAATGGAFDPTVQPLWLAVARGETGETGEEARARLGWQHLRQSPHEIALRPGMALTFNGIAQGFAADRIAGLMRAEGYRDLLIDAGEVQALGKAGSRPWRAGIADADGRLLRRLSLRDRALATSSPQGTLIGRGAPHILHPAGRAPVWQTVSVSAPSAALADALSTAFCVMRRDEIDAALAAFPQARVEYLG